MDVYGLFECVQEGAKWLAIGGAAYVGALAGANILASTLFHKKIQSQQELLQIVEEEAEKLGLDASKIDAVYGAKDEDGLATTDGVIARKGGGRSRYSLHIAGGFTATRPTVRHELYHIYKGDFDETPSWWRYFFIYEPRATIYELTGLKL